VTTSEPAQPLVRIGIPTYNRAATLDRSIASALRQTHRNIELVVSDDGSTDGTEALCRRWEKRDGRMRYVRHTRIGLTANFNFLWGELRGEYVQMLADDDWFDDDYVETCLAELRGLPDHVIVGGWPRWVRPDGRPGGDGVLMQLEYSDPARRVVDFYRRVEDNGSTFYGLARGEALAAAGPMRNVLGNDWHHVAGLAFLGKVRTVTTTRIHRSLGGTSDTIEAILTAFATGTRLQARLPYVAMGAYAFDDVVRRSPAFRVLGPVRRLSLGIGVALAVVRWSYSAWHLAGPALLRLRARPRARRMVDALIRRGGGTPPGAG